jgi:hypothetical protein
MHEMEGPRPVLRRFRGRLPGRAHGFHLGQPVTWLENADRPYTRASDPPEVPVSQLFPRSGLNPAWSPFPV